MINSIDVVVLALKLYAIASVGFRTSSLLWMNCKAKGFAINNNGEANVFVDKANDKPSALFYDLSAFQFSFYFSIENHYQCLCVRVIVLHRSGGTYCNDT